MKTLQVNCMIWKPFKSIYRSANPENYLLIEIPPNLSIWKPSKLFIDLKTLQKNLLIWKLSAWIHWSENPPHENINLKTFHMNILIWKPSAWKYQPANFPHEYLDLKTLHENINLEIFLMNISGWSPARASVKILGIHTATRHLVNSWKILEMQMKTEYNMVSIWAVIWVPKCN